MSIRVGVQFTGWPFGAVEGRRFFDFVERIEALGLDSLWVSDRVISTTPTLGSIAALAAAAARTSRMKFGSSVLILPTRHPVEIAKEIATIDVLSGGRMLPAFGLGPDDEREYEAAGVKKSERAGRLDEAVGILRRLWTEDHVTHHGRFYHLTDVTITPKPVQRPCLPIWFGGRSPAAQRRVGRLGDGWLASAVTPDEMREGIHLMQDAATEAGRAIDPDHVGVIVTYRVAESNAAARDGLVSAQTRARPDVPAESYSALGTPSDCVAMIEQYVAAGVSKFVLRPSCRPEELNEQIEVLAKEIAPAVERLAVGVGNRG